MQPFQQHAVAWCLGCHCRTLNTDFRSQAHGHLHVQNAHRSIDILLTVRNTLPRTLEGLSPEREHSPLAKHPELPVEAFRWGLLPAFLQYVFKLLDGVVTRDDAVLNLLCRYRVRVPIPLQTRLKRFEEVCQPRGLLERLVYFIILTFECGVVADDALAYRQAEGDNPNGAASDGERVRNVGGEKEVVEGGMLGGYRSARRVRAWCPVKLMKRSPTRVKRRIERGMEMSCSQWRQAASPEYVSNK